MKKVMPYVFTIAIVIVGFYIGSSDVVDIDKWPDDLVNNGYKFCSLNNFQSCKEGDWFGIYDSQMPKSVASGLYKGKHHPIAVFCEPIGDPPSNRKFRRIVTENGDVLRLCLMRDPQEIIDTVREIANE